MTEFSGIVSNTVQIDLEANGSPKHTVSVVLTDLSKESLYELLGALDKETGRVVFILRSEKTKEE